MPTQGIDLSLFHQFAIALLIGALIGTEREKNKALKQTPSFAGIRTFIFLAEAGALSAWLAQQQQQPLIFVVALLCVLVLIGLAYSLEMRADPRSVGVTTELGALTVFLLGGAVLFGHSALAVALAVVNTSVLAFKDPLHGVVHKLGSDDIFAGLKLLIATFIVLPLLPLTAIDPWGALVPYKLWLLVIMISALSLVGYVATRALGSARGVAVTGVSGGLVSSTAVTLSLSRESRGGMPGTTDDAYAAGILVAWLVMFFRVALMVVLLNRDLVAPLLLPFAVMVVANAGFAGSYYLRSLRAASAHGDNLGVVEVKNPFSLWAASKFGLLFAIVLLVVEITRRSFSASGIVFVGIVAGTTDVDAITLSMADFARDPAQLQIAVQAIVAAILSNTVIKASLAAGLGSRGLARKVLPATAAIIVGGVVTLFLV